MDGDMSLDETLEMVLAVKQASASGQVIFDSNQEEKIPRKAVIDAMDKYIPSVLYRKIANHELGQEEYVSFARACRVILKYADGLPRLH